MATTLTPMEKWQGALDNQFDFGANAYQEAIPDLANANATAQGVSKLQGQTALNQSKMSSDLAQRMGKFHGMQDQYAKDAFDYNSLGRQEQAVGKATADVAQKFSDTQGQANRQLLSMGVNPNSGRYAAMQGQLGIAQASAQAQAANKARQDLDNTANERQKTAIGFGNNLAQNANSAAQTAALTGNAAATTAALPLSNKLKFAGGINDLYSGAATGNGNIWKATNLTAAEQANIAQSEQAANDAGWGELIGAGAKLLGTSTGKDSTLLGDIWKAI